MRRAAGVVALGATIALVGAGVGAGATIAAPHSSAVNPTMPTIKVTASGKHTYTVSGLTTFTAGRVQLVLKSVKGEHEAELGSLHKGYTFKKLRADLKAFGQKQGSGKNGSTPKSALRHLNRAISHSNFYGGLDSIAGQTERGTMVLPKPGTYYVVNDTNLPKAAQKLTVTGPKVNRAAPKSSVTETALTTRRFGGPTHLPAKGTITFKNKSTESPHFLAMAHVKKGTTKKQVLNELQSNGKGPNYFLKGQAATDPVGEGNSQTLSYNVPKGTYAQVCFFPDPKTGMPHAFMGMIRIVHLK